ncbi:HEPN domain-containing protein [Enterocloster clostridioformis]|uniref:HEPN domain-containing protein n=1 Tax=Enterocloster clostridioformis TaxID=1531 RepID=UPI0026770CAB|nr:HEPN domain-containing protein [Enterocloster clostridioformis]
MSPNSGNLRDLALHRLTVAKEDLATAKDFIGKHFRAANNRAYYSIYHSITAVLALEQVAFKRHKDTIAYFNKEYVKTEKFSRQLGRRIGRAQEIRHASDYDEFYIASVEEDQEQIDAAELVLNAVEQYVSSFGK